MNTCNVYSVLCVYNKYRHYPHSRRGASALQGNAQMLSTLAKLFTYTPLVLFERVKHVKTMYKYNCCADTVLIAAEKRRGDFLQLSSVNKLTVVHGIAHDGLWTTDVKMNSHVKFLAYIEDETGSLLPVAKLLLRVNTICSARSVLKLFFCEQPPPRVSHFSDADRYILTSYSTRTPSAWS